MRVAAVGTVGVHHCHRFRQDLFAFVVVSNHKVDAQLFAQLRFFHSGDAAVHGDNQPDAFFVQVLDGNGIQAVAFFQTAGDIADHIRAAGAQEGGQKTGGCDAVHIIVAKYGDFFTPSHGEADSVHRKVHIRHQKRIRQNGVTA